MNKIIQKLLEVIYIIDWSNLISTFLAVILGGFITWLTTSRSLKKQFNNELKIKEINKKQKILNSLSGIKLEIGYNVKNAVKKRKIIESKKEKKGKYNFINFDYLNLVTGFKKSKWEELNHKINFNFLEDLVINLQTFYMDISAVIDTKLITEEKNKDILEKGAQCVEKLNKQIKILENEINKIENSI